MTVRTIENIMNRGLLSGAAGDELGFVRSQTENSVGDVVRFAHVAYGMPLGKFFPERLDALVRAGSEFLHERGPDVARMNRIYPVCPADSRVVRQDVDRTEFLFDSLENIGNLLFVGDVDMVVVPNL